MMPHGKFAGNKLTDGGMAAEPDPSQRRSGEPAPASTEQPETDDLGHAALSGAEFISPFIARDGSQEVGTTETGEPDGMTEGNEVIRQWYEGKSNYR